MVTVIEKPNLEGVKQAVETLKGVSTVTPLAHSHYLSKKFECNVILKREDLQIVRSYKLRGAFNKISTLTKTQQVQGIVCASAGNHAQGVAFACERLQIEGTIFMPTTTPKQKLESVSLFGKNKIKVILSGDTFDDCKKEAIAFSKNENKTFIHPFDDSKIIEGQGTIGLEILEQSETTIDYLLAPIGGGGLAAGLVTVFKELSPQTKIIGVEPKLAASMTYALEQGHNAELDRIEKFVDGAAVKKVGTLNYAVCKDKISQMLTVDSGHACNQLIELYNREAIVAEPAGVLSICGLEEIREKIKGKNVVCILSGGNNDISRMEEIKEKAATYRGERHYFLVQFPQRSGALKEFVLDVLSDNDDIFHFQYIKKHARNFGSAVVGIDIGEAGTFEELKSRMIKKGFYKDYINENQALMDVLV